MNKDNMKQRLNHENFISYVPESGYFSIVYHIAWTVRLGFVLFYYHDDKEMPSELQITQSNLVLQHLERIDFLEILDRWVYQFWQDDFDQEYAEEEYKLASKNIALDNIGHCYRLDEFCIPCKTASESSGFLVRAPLTCDWRLMDAEMVFFFQREFVECLWIGNFSGVSGFAGEEDPKISRTKNKDTIEREVYSRKW